MHEVVRCKLVDVLMVLQFHGKVALWLERRPHLTLAVLPPTRTAYGRLPLLCSAQLPPRTTAPVHVDDPHTVPHRTTPLCLCSREGLDRALDVDSGLCPKFGAAHRKVVSFRSCFFVTMYFAHAPLI